MIEPYKNKERWESWKQTNNKTPKGIKKEDWKLLIAFLEDMEMGLNTPPGMKGKRGCGTLLNLSSHNQLFLKRLNISVL